MDDLIRRSDALKLFEEEERYGYIDEQDVLSVPAANVRENDVLEELINEAVLTLNNIYIGCRIKKDDYVRLLNDIRAIRGSNMDRGDGDNT